jgi:hypothetical protein
MAYDTKELEKMALDAIKKHEIVFIDELACHLPCDRSTIFNHNLNELDSIKDALNLQKTSLKKDLRGKWRDSDNATTQIALYKLVSDNSEFTKLTGQQIDHTTGGDKVNINVVKSYD